MMMRRKNKLLLEPVEERTCLAEKDGLLVFSGSAIGEISGSVYAHRDARLEKLDFLVVRK